ncbi:MAG: TlpA disulfide reductase family protein [Halioglobus sp.]|nr:TlpA disulfide reductase family protein [Halioglobus sp.]
MHTNTKTKPVCRVLFIPPRLIFFRPILLAWLVFLPLWAQAEGVIVGQEAPAVSLPTLSGSGNISLESLRGKVVYLDFWASWCGPCRVSFPILEKLAIEFGPQGFEVLAINVDEVEADAQQFLADIPVSYLVVRDGQAISPQVYGIMGMPTGYLIDRQGVVREIHQGFRKSDGDELRAEIVMLLKE